MTIKNNFLGPRKRWLRPCFMLFQSMAFLRLYPIILAWDRSRDPELHRTCWTTRGHLHDGVILLLRPESFSLFLSYLNFGNPGEVWITKALICTRKQNPEGFCNLVILVKWCHRANGLLNLSLIKADTHEGFCSQSMLQAHFARVSTHEGAFSSSLNLLRELSPKYLTG